MELNPARRSIRLEGYEYAADGSYFITICTQHKEHRFGHIIDDIMVLNEAGVMITERIQAIPAKFPGTLIDSFVVMPNHVHMIVSIVGAAHRGRPLSDRQGRICTLPHDDDSHNSEKLADESDWLSLSGPVGPKAGGHDGPPLHGNDPVISDGDDGNDPPVGNVPSLSTVIGWFKASTTNYYIKGIKTGTYPAFDRRLWQRNYYEHIIRTGNAYNQIDEYIRINPQRWSDDRLR